MVDDKELKKLRKAYRKISYLTGIKLEETVNESYGLVIKKDHELYGQIGVYYCSENFTHYFKFKDKKELVSFGSFDSKLDNEIFWARNVMMVLEEIEKIKN